jgi:hypothetical protein
LKASAPSTKRFLNFFCVGFSSSNYISFHVFCTQHVNSCNHFMHISPPHTCSHYVIQSAHSRKILQQVVP